MATESLTRLRAGFEAWNRRDYDTVLEYFRDDVVWRTGTVFPGFDAVYEGHAGMRRFYETFGEPWEEISVEIEQVLDEREEQIVCLSRFDARGRGGIEVNSRFFQVYRYDENHLVKEFHAFAEDEEDDARRYAGLAEP